MEVWGGDAVMTCRDPSWGSDLKFMDRFGNARLIKVTSWRDKLQPDQSENFSVFLCVFRDKPAARPRPGSWSVWRGARLGRVGVTPGHISIAASLLLCQWDRWAVSLRPAAGSALLLAEMRHQWSMWVNVLLVRRSSGQHRNLWKFGFRFWFQQL